MPFGALNRPPLGISLLKGRLAELGVSCDIWCAAFPFAEFIGYEEYQWISSELPYTAFAGDWVFTRSLYGANRAAEDHYLQEVIRETWRLDEISVNRILYIQSFVGYFLDHCMAAVPWDDYEIVGFTSTFEQNIASLSLAKRLKEAHPNLSIVFGGANWEGEMGQELHKCFPFVDYVCTGEADESFPALVSRVLDGEAVGQEGNEIQGLVYRKGSESICTGPADLIYSLDDLPIPDYSDYFHELAQSAVATSVANVLLMETSRGCWWGAKSHCTFCGLNGGAMEFRGKNAERAMDELNYLVDKWQIDYVEMVDNILDMRYFKDFLPMLAEAQKPVQIFYEVKANLTREQIKTLHEAGVHRIQPGLESMNDHVLQLMRKGTTTLRNIQLLKWCKEYDIAVDWNILYGFPGETQEDYDDMLEILPSIRFLDPPTACGPVRLDRFSPYYNNAAMFGLVNLRPIAPLKYLYPFDEDSLLKISYYFDYDFQNARTSSEFSTKVIAFAEDWHRNPEAGALFCVPGSDGALTLNDTRSDAFLPELTLSGMEQVAYEYCAEMRNVDSIAKHLRSEFGDVQFADEQLVTFLNSLVANRLMVTDNERYLSLALSARS